jgi:hypothetical protein
MARLSPRDAGPRTRRPSRETWHLLAIQRVTAANAGEAGIVAVGRDPLGFRLQSERRRIGIGDEVTTGPGPPAEVEKDLPVTRPRCEHDQMLMLAEFADECHRPLDGGRRVEDPGVRDDPQAAARWPVTATASRRWARR